MIVGGGVVYKNPALCLNKGMMAGKIKENNQNTKEQLAAHIVDYVRDELLISLPFLNRAILKMPVEFLTKADVSEEILGGVAFATNGAVIYTDADKVIDLFEKERGRLQRVYLHMIFHCIFSHPFKYDKMAQDLWDFSADVAVEDAVMRLGIKSLELPDDNDRKRVIEETGEAIGEVTAERIYHGLIWDKGLKKRLLKKAELFKQDSHRRWSYNNEIPEMMETNKGVHDVMEDNAREWVKLSSSSRIAMQTKTKGFGEETGGKTWRIPKVYRDNNDYRDFLKQFAVNCEEVHINREEFDYIYYTYGLELYEDMPLIEPLEYRDAAKIRELVIAIDTSGSTQGRKVRSFLNRTYSIFKQSGSFFKHMNVHIIQCDSEVQKDVKITSEEQFERYMQNIEIIGAGGTSFVPVFNYVNKLIDRGEFVNLQGLLYFTDGMGRFPEKKPPYKTAFIFQGGGEIPEVPPWALKLVLQDETVVD